MFSFGKDGIFYVWVWNSTRIRAKCWILEIIKGYDFTVKSGKIKHLKATNLQFIEPTKYLIKYPTTLTIYEYKVNEIANKPFYIKEHKQKYNPKEIKQILIKFKI